SDFRFVRANGRTVTTPTTAAFAIAGRDAALRRGSLTCGLTTANIGKLTMRSVFMLAFPPMSGARKHPAARAMFAGFICASVAGPVQGQGTVPQRDLVPNFAPSSTMGWLKAGAGDEFLPPDAGPGPVVYDATVKPVGNFLVTTGNPR